ncbi:MAG: alpha/beta hydrolase [Verrucomicrobia bacterium]|nr:alpha/beta hydrolase [Verrucomicrobiota bacterium]
MLTCARAAEPKPTWIDSSPHQIGFVTVNGVRLHFLDWGGKGVTLLFLHGDGESAHIFDDLAPRFTDRFRVLGLTQRGHGQSAQPTSGYDTGTLVEDLRQFLDALKIKRVILAGHGRAGDELTAFAIKFPKRVSKLVYFDAAYDHATGRALIDAREALLPQFPKHDNEAYDAARTWYQLRYGCTSLAIDAAIRESTVLRADGTLEDRTPQRIYDTLAIGTAARPNYPKIKVPALSFYARGDVAALIRDAEKRREAQPTLTAFESWRQAEIDLFRRRMRRGRVVEMPNALHYCFIQRQDEVVREMRAFLLSQPERRQNLSLPGGTARR